MESQSAVLLKGDQTRFLDYTFANVQCQNINITNNLIISSIASVSPVEGAVVSIPSGISYLIIQNTTFYTDLTLKLPFKPIYGQLLTIISTIDIINLQFTGGTISTQIPNSITNSIPLKFIFAGTWFSC